MAETTDHLAKDVSYRHKLSILMAIVFPCLVRLMLQGSGIEHEIVRYAIPLFFGGMFGYVIGGHLDNRQKELDLSRKTNISLHKNIKELKILQGIIPICSHCKQIRDEKGEWLQIEKYIQQHSEARFSHSLCPSCIQKHYPTFHECKK
ncbi:MAG: hypothetical protein WBB19_16470 [Desulforhopalus sp.]